MALAALKPRPSELSLPIGRGEVYSALHRNLGNERQKRNESCYYSFICNDFLTFGFQHIKEKTFPLSRQGIKFYQVPLRALSFFFLFCVRKSSSGSCRSGSPHADLYRHAQVMK